MSKITKEINKVSLTVIGLSGKLAFYALAAAILILGARKGYEFGHSIFYSPAIDPDPGTTKTITLTGEESVFDVGSMLEKAGLVRDKNAFAIQALCYEYEVKAGTYQLSTADSSKELIHILEAGSEEETAAES